MQLWWIGLSALAMTAPFPGVGLAYEPLEVGAGGSIKGKITYKGAPPETPNISITKDVEVCGRDKKAATLVIGPDRGIKNVVVRIVDIKRGKRLAEPTDVAFKQKGCEYVPHILLFPAGSRIRIQNDDGILHNTAITAESNPSFSVAQPKFRRVVEKRIEQPEMPIRVRCDVHSWMGAWWISQEHPYYAVTDVHGAFALEDVPPGNYTIEAWHETLGKLTKGVVIKPGEQVPVTLEMSSH